MYKYTEIYGVDISKVVFDVHGSKAGHVVFNNTEKGFVSFFKSSRKTLYPTNRKRGLSGVSNTGS
jgi:transposase